MHGSHCQTFAELRSPDDSWRSTQTDGAAQREVAASFLDAWMTTSRSPTARALLRWLHIDTLENAQPIELALCLEHRRVAERLSRIDARLAQRRRDPWPTYCRARLLRRRSRAALPRSRTTVACRLCIAHRHPRCDLHLHAAAVRVERLRKPRCRHAGTAG